MNGKHLGEIIPIVWLLFSAMVASINKIGGENSEIQLNFNLCTDDDDDVIVLESQNIEINSQWLILR